MFVHIYRLVIFIFIAFFSTNSYCENVPEKFENKLFILDSHIEELGSRYDYLNRRIDLIDILQDRIDVLEKQNKFNTTKNKEIIIKVSEINQNISDIYSSIKLIDSDFEENTKKQSQNYSSLSSLLVSLQNNLESLDNIIQGKNIEFKNSLEVVNKDVKNNHYHINLFSIVGVISGLVLLLVLITVFLFLKKRINNNKLSIDSIRHAQKIIENTQKQLQEESIKFDNQFLEIAIKQINEITQSRKQTTIEVPQNSHALVIKLADELARIETNLAKMDKSVRGYKQLVQAKERMINNMKAFGYEIINLIGEEYNEGMVFEARFVPDENLPEGKRIITGMVKMLVKYNGQMIQPAQIIVSQNI